MVLKIHNLIKFLFDLIKKIIILNQTLDFGVYRNQTEINLIFLHINIKDMKYLNSIKALYFSVAILLLTAIGGHYLDYDYERISIKHRDLRVRVERLIRYNIELSGIVNQAVIGEDSNHVVKYGKIIQGMELNISSMRNLAQSGEVNAALDIVDSANTVRKKMEISAILASQEGNLAKCKSIIFGREYRKIRKVYSEGNAKAFRIITTGIAEKEETYKNIKLIALIVRISALLLLIWVGILFTRRIKKDTGEQQKLENEIREVNSGLELTIKERTFELEKTLRELEAINMQLQSQNEALNKSTIVSIGDLQGNIKFVNSVFCEKFKYNKEELIGKPYKILNSGYHSKEFWKELWDTLLSGKSWRGEVNNRCKDGSFLWVDTIIVPVRDSATEEISEFFSIRFDITERKNMEMVVKDAEEKNRLVLESMSDGLFGIDMDGRITFVNLAACNMLGFSESELMGNEIHAMIHHSYSNGKEYPSHLCPMDRTYIENKSYTIKDEFFWRKDGSTFPVEYSSTPMYKNENVVGAVVSFRDISQIVELSTYFSAFLENTDDFIFFKDKQFRFRMLSQKFAEYLKTNHWTELIGKTDHDIEEKNKADVYRKSDIFIMTTGKEITDFEEEIVMPNGDKLWTISSKKPIRDSSGEIVGIIGISRDISHRKNAENEILKSKDYLEKILTLAPVGLIIIDFRTLRPLLINKAFIEIFDLDCDNLADCQSKNIYLDKDDKNKLLIELKENGKILNREMEFRRHRSGNKFWALFSMQVMEYFDNEVIIAGYHDISDGKKLQLDLEYQLEFTGALVDTLPSALFYKNAKGVFVGANKTYEEAFGVSRDFMIGKTVLELPYIPEENRKAFHQEDMNIIQTCGSISREIDIDFMDGKTHTTLYSVSGFKLKNGEPGGLIGLLHDITHRKENEERLQKAKEMAETVIHKSPLPMFIYDLENDERLLVNKALLDFHGLSTDQVLNISIKDSFVDFEKDFAEISNQISTRGSVEKFEVMIIKHTTKEIRSCLLSVNKIEYNDQPSLVVSFIDITDTIKLQQELVLAKEAAEKIVDAIPIPTAVTSVEDGKILRVNDAMIEFHGIKKEELSKLSSFEWYVNQDDREELIIRLKDIGVIKNEEILFKRYSSGEIRQCLVSLIPLKYEGAEVLVGCIIDITNLKNIQLELKKATMAAEEATASKSAFLANMSHEIRTPMNAIIGLSHLALQTELDSKQHDYLSKIDRSAKSLLGIINDILDFSKIEAGKLNIEYTDFNLENVFEAVANLTTIKAQEKGLEVVFAYSSDVPKRLNGDPLRIGQILTNLCSNAVKFTDEGEIVISTKILDIHEDIVSLEFSVRDTGIGLSQDQINRLFQSFTQADSSTTRKYGGTGLGLTICKKLVELMNGKIWVESEIGKGSTFYFTLNFNRVKDDSENLLITDFDMKNLRILVCDDNKTARELLREALESFSFRVTCVESGKDSIEELEKNQEEPYDLVIMDWKMPEMDGLETCAKIKKKNNIPKMPLIIMVTAYDKEQVFDQANTLGLNGFLIKPISYSMLYDAILSAFGKKELQKARRKTKALQNPESIVNLRGNSILVVEDNEINQQIAKELLKSAGLFVDVADDGKQAIEMIERSGVPSKYSLVLMDLQMPVMDGITATREIRKNENYVTLPIIAMTADAMSGVKEKCLEAGMVDFVTKPIDPDDIFNVLSRWIKVKGNNFNFDDGSFNVYIEKTKLPVFTNINSAEGLIRVNGNQKLYMKLLESFMNSFKDFENDIETTILDGNLEALQLKLHTLKGVSGNIGANDLHKKAAELENLMKNNVVSDFRLEFVPLINQLSLVIHELEIFFTELTDTAARGAVVLVDYVKLGILFDELLVLLKDDDYTAQNKLDEILALPGISKFDAEIKMISLKTNNYDFEGAIALLEKAKLQLKSN